MNPIEKLLNDLEIIDTNYVEVFYPKVRDNVDIKVMRCKKSGVIFLSTADHMSYSHYENQKGVNYWTSVNRELALRETYEDDNRRFHMFNEIVKDTIYLDVGTGLGGVLDLFKPIANSVQGIELQKEIREVLLKMGYMVYGSIQEVPDKNTYDVVSLFHVFEHLIEPIDTLLKIKNVMKDGGKIIIEVPHARDFLFNQLDLEVFKKFTFWSEHLILHTKESLKKILEVAGFKEINIQGFQRYGLANHLYWLRHLKPGGQKIWSQLSTDEMNKAYSKLLQDINQTDTIIATAVK